MPHQCPSPDESRHEVYACYLLHFHQPINVCKTNDYALHTAHHNRNPTAPEPAASECLLVQNAQLQKSLRPSGRVIIFVASENSRSLFSLLKMSMAWTDSTSQ